MAKDDGSVSGSVGKNGRSGVTGRPAEGREEATREGETGLGDQWTGDGDL